MSTVRPSMRHHRVAPGFDSSPVGAVIQPGSDPMQRLRPGARRRHRAGVRPPLALILLMQTILTLRLSNTAFQDEALYLDAGHRIWSHWLHGTGMYDKYITFFSGSPYLYPPLVAPFDSIGGVIGARLLSLVLMLVTTLMVHGTSRRLVGERAALLGAAVFALTSSTLFVGWLATYDALAIFLLALSCRIGVGARRWGVACAGMAVALMLAVEVKYAGLMYVPVVLMVAVLARRRGFLASLGSGVFASLAFGAVLAGVTWVTGGVPEGFSATTSERPDGGNTVEQVLMVAARGIGPALVLALLGAIRLVRPGDSPWRSGPLWRRSLLALTLLGAGLLAPAYQSHLHTTVSLHKHIGFGMIFLAPLAGLAVSGLLALGRHESRGVVLVLATALVLGAFGNRESSQRFHDWPDSKRLIQALRTQVRPGDGRYLVEEPEVPRYYLRDLVRPYQWNGLGYFGYKTPTGQWLEGLPAYDAALRAGYFDLVVLRYSDPMAGQVGQALERSRKYERIATLPAVNSYGAGHWMVFRRR